MALSLLDDKALGGRLRPGLDALAGRLCEVLPEVPATSPVLLSGDWGSGKTSLLRTVRARLDEPFLDVADRSTVWFDAWHHEGEGALLPPLLRRVWESAPAGYRRTEQAVGLLAKLTRFAVALGLRAVPVVAAALGYGNLGNVTTKLGANAVRDESTAVPLPFSSAEPPEDPVESLRLAFATLLEEAFSGRVVTIFVDDLDRCSPDGAVALLDAIRMLIAGAAEARCRFVVAIDRAVVVEAISAKFDKIRGYDGNRYLEKLFPLEFHVPPPSPAEASQLVGELLFGETDERNRVALGQTLAQPLFANPRLMKRCINKFRLVRHFEQSVQEATGIAAAGGSSEDRADRDLAEWIAATERWPALRALARKTSAEAWDVLLREFTERNLPEGHVRPELIPLRQQPGLLAWVQASPLMKSGHCRAADDRLRLAGL